jgi:uncharacterized protein (DUF2141 family)
MKTHLPLAALLLLGCIALLPVDETTATAEPNDDESTGEIRFQVRIDEKRGGHVLCALYRDEDTWLSERPFRNAKTETGRPWVTCVFAAVPFDTYAIAALHDEDDDGKMDKNFLGMPREGYAASRDAHFKGIGAPDWEDAIFPHRAPRTVQRARMKH